MNKSLTKVALRYRALFLDIYREALLHKLQAKLSIGELLEMKASGQKLTKVENADEADEAYTYEWALNPADVTKLLYI